MKDKNSGYKTEYNPSQIEAKWRKYWVENKTFTPDLKNAKNPFYNLWMFPYPSGEGLHVGHFFASTGSDIYGRFKRMQGKDVFQPIGYDAFGIHSENYALKIGVKPQDLIDKTTKRYEEQLKSTGHGYDWTRTVTTSDPSYYKWTQWLFIEMFKQGLAYRKKAEVNWCPGCKTVLADEQVINGECERCGSKVEKRDLTQWFFKITAYADSLLSGLDKINWPQKIKIAQKNWIGKSQGAVIEFQVAEKDRKIKVFTTRPDTLFGATFLVLSPEHSLTQEIDQESIKEYIKKTQSKTDEERIAEGQEKTGVFSGFYAINPVNNQRIPIWIADYVLMEYGTGAIMAVPAHDQRDYEFAKKYNLPIKQVIAPYTVVDGVDAPRTDNDIFEFEAVTAIIKHWEKDLYYIVAFKNSLWGLVGGHVEDGEGSDEAIRREVAEESGYTDFKKVELIFERAYSRGYKTRKSREELCLEKVYFVELESGKRGEIQDHETKQGSWMSKEEILKLPDFLSHHKLYFEHAIEEKAYTGEGVIVNSGEWDGLSVPSEIGKVIEWLEKKGIGKKEVHYHLRDWLISRQRYWGPPIPMIFCENCEKQGKGERGDMPGWWTVPENQLPVELPDVKDWKPLGTGKAPLANHPEFFETKCPSCGHDAIRETDVSDTFLDSAWYYLRYLSLSNNEMPYDIDIVKKWCPVDMYIGGAEHSVLHLLYVRFVAMVLHNLKNQAQNLALPFEEPFPRFFAHGLIVKDGAKMSKSRGNVVIPDEYIKKYGADSMRLYMMFLGPLDQNGDFRDSGIEGMYRFVRRVWVLLTSEVSDSEISDERLRMMHKTIKQVTEDIESLSYNTAIARMMEWYNFLSEETKDQKSKIKTEEREAFLKLLAPFAPFMAEDLWVGLSASEGDRLRAKRDSGGRVFQSIHFQPWPSYDEKYLVEEEVVIPVQVNGKRRGEVRIKNNELGIRNLVEERARKEVENYIKEKIVKNVIYVEGKIINFVTD